MFFLKKNKNGSEHLDLELFGLQVHIDFSLTKLLMTAMYF